MSDLKFDTKLEFDTALDTLRDEINKHRDLYMLPGTRTQQFVVDYDSFDTGSLFISEITLLTHLVKVSRLYRELIDITANTDFTNDCSAQIYKEQTTPLYEYLCSLLKNRPRVLFAYPHLKGMHTTLVCDIQKACIHMQDKTSEEKLAVFEHADRYQKLIVVLGY